MKKLLNILSAIILASSISTSVIACDGEISVKTDISNKIGSAIDLGQLSANTADEFKNILQIKLITMTDLSKITAADYDVYKATTTDNITDSDVNNGISLNIKIVAKGNNFTGVKDNINVSYTKKVTIDISNKIGSAIDLGQLSANTADEFKNILQIKLITMTDLSKITAADYDVYKATTTDNITDSDVNNGISLNIKIVAKGNNFTGVKDNINVSYTKKVTIDISNKIGSAIDLGQLSANTVDEFKNILQTKLITMTDLSKITAADYDVYKATTTDNITDSDVNNGISLNIKIVAKGNNFTGVKDNINVSYTKVKIDISNKIGSAIDLGQLSANTVDEFKNILQTKLITMTDLSKITAADYDVYKATTTDDITDSDVNNGISLNIKIVAKGNNFTGVKDNIKINYVKVINLDTIITTKTLGKIYISKKDVPNKTEILSAIKTNNTAASNLTESDFNFKNLQSVTSATIVGTNKYIGEIVLSYTCNNFLQMTGTSLAVRGLTTDTIGNVYAGGDNGIVYKLTTGATDFTPMTGTAGKIKSLTSDKDGNVYAGSVGVVYKLTTGATDFTPMTGTAGEIYSLTSDKDGNVYAGSSGVVYKLTTGATDFTPMTGTAGVIYSLTSDKDGNVYAGSSGSGSVSGVYKLTTGSTSFDSTPMSGGVGPTYSLTSDKDGNVYAAGANGIVYKLTTGSVTFIAMTGTSHIIRSLTSDKDGNVYVGGDAGNVYRSNGNSAFTPMTGTAGVILSLTSDTDGNVYVGSENSNVYKS